ncbi:hypothetical protein E1A91_A12G184300v1 [Gossypium mustelinum]|uniref:Uncharacterized protein n=1 Tax=Gossypium mustelinum TaxID=34275 RepID=A0A5D2WXH8_GOSMU|nr:hypothetical protein E1A91_A12G184300v1 [Gossypium mustelinum]TYJ05742.1 hypothetical protein E1A91_A12G184300v1 [Gossypium mustelinum]
MVVSLHWIRPNLAFTITIFDLCDKSLHVIKIKHQGRLYSEVERCGFRVKDEIRFGRAHQLIFLHWIGCFSPSIHFLFYVPLTFTMLY